MAEVRPKEKARYKAPVFAVFPFNPPTTFSYPVPNIETAEPSIQRVVHYMEEAAKEPLSKQRKTKRKAKSGASVRKKPAVK
ncbi:hypothetical protein GMRT_15596 [Giardia muris]|uniref:Uncharacterized protein n=1 Tax=Giardia muris TaxID=5742 RepID=A0A4Z1T499_GIAMU|nr:hypothetical protein GMRT_15596 [Giardia muris]|eukprot:TNJ28813.1 hypothetical protein GMRT_15596 [Giardia muris]